jgi:Protein of unknown function (DUF732)
MDPQDANTVVADTVLVEHQTELAWSTDQEPQWQEPEYRHTWVSTLGLTVSIVATTAVGAAMLLGVFGDSHSTSPDAPTVSVRADQPSTLPPVVISSTPNMVNVGTVAVSQNLTQHSDNVYLGLLKEGEIYIYSPDLAIDYGHTICNARGSGMTDKQIIQIEATEHPEMGWKFAPVQVRAAELSYCIQYAPGAPVR